MSWKVLPNVLSHKRDWLFAYICLYAYLIKIFLGGISRIVAMDIISILNHVVEYLRQTAFMTWCTNFGTRRWQNLNVNYIHAGMGIWFWYWLWQWLMASFLKLFFIVAILGGRGRYAWPALLWYLPYFSMEVKFEVLTVTTK